MWLLMELATLIPPHDGELEQEQREVRPSSGAASFQDLNGITRGV
jgi:hypothetical protein